MTPGQRLLGTLGVIIVFAASVPVFAIVPSRVDGMTYHDLVVGRGDSVKPGDKVRITVKTYLFDQHGPEGRGAFATERTDHLAIVGKAELGGTNHFVYELGVVGMRVGGQRLIYAPGLYADTYKNGKPITRPFVVEIKSIRVEKP